MFLTSFPDFETPDAFFFFFFTDSLRGTIFQDKHFGKTAQTCLSELSEVFEEGCYYGDI